MQKKNNIVGILFSGGKGSRLFPINEFYQKVMMPIGAYGTPLLEFVIRHLKYHGITEFIALIGYRGEMIRRYFGDGEKFGIKIQYCFDDPRKKGTGAVLWNAKDLIGDRDMLVYYTDILTSLDVKGFIDDFYKKPWALGNLWLDQNWNEMEKMVDFNDDMTVKRFVTTLNDKSVAKDDRIYINTGISILRNDIFDIIEKLVEEKKEQDIVEIDLSADVLSALAKEGKLAGYVSEDWWVDVGSITRLTSLSPHILLRQMAHLSMEVQF